MMLLSTCIFCSIHSEIWLQILNFIFSTVFYYNLYFFYRSNCSVWFWHAMAWISQKLVRTLPNKLDGPDITASEYQMLSQVDKNMHTECKACTVWPVLLLPKSTDAICGEETSIQFDVWTTWLFCCCVVSRPNWGTSNKCSRDLQRFVLSQFNNVPHACSYLNWVTQALLAYINDGRLFPRSNSYSYPWLTTLCVNYTIDKGSLKNHTSHKPCNTVYTDTCFSSYLICKLGERC